MSMKKTVAPDQKDSWWEKDATEIADAEHKQLQQITFSLGNFDDEQRTFQAIASTPIVDRQGDSIDQSGWDLTNFLKTPTIPWAHDYYTPPVARVTEIGVNKQGNLQFTYQAPPVGLYDLADTVWNLYRNQFMFAFSVGFIPKDYEGNYSDGYEFTQCELLEISAVVVPANPQAVALAYKMDVISERQAKSLRGKMSQSLKSLDEALTRGAITGATLPLADKGQAWSKSTAVAAVKKWASDADGNIDFGKYKKAFMYVEDGAGDKQGDYKFPFATVEDGELHAVWNAVKSVMSVLNGGMGGASISDADKESVYGQVKKYYKAFDEDVPDLKSINGDEMTKTKTDKGAIADELAEEEVIENKSDLMGGIWEVFWAFYDVWYDPATPSSDFSTLVSEFSSILQTIADGTYNGPGSDDDDNDDASDEDSPLGPLMSSIKADDKDKIKAFMELLMATKTASDEQGLTNTTNAKDNKDMTKSQKDVKAVEKSGSVMSAEDKDQLTAIHKDMDSMQKTMGSYQTKMEAHKVNIAKMLGMETTEPASDEGNDDDPDNKKVDDKKVVDKDVTEEVVEGEEETEETETPEVPEVEKTVETEEVIDNKEVSKKLDDKTKSEQGEVKSADSSDDGADQGEKEDEEVDPDNLTDEQAEEVLKAVNETLDEISKENKS